MHFARKFSRGPWVQERACLWEYNGKDAVALPLKVATALLSGSMKGAVGA